MKESRSLYLIFQYNLGRVLASGYGNKNKHTSQSGLFRLSA